MFKCLTCGCTLPCEPLTLLHWAIAHRGGNLATTILADKGCQQCLWQATEPLSVSIVEGKVQRTVMVGNTPMMVLY